MKQTIVALLVGCVVSAGYGQDFLSKAKVALGMKDTTTAITMFEQALKTGQKPADVNYNLGAIKYARSQLAEAKKYFDEAIRIDDENLEALRLLGETELKLGDTQGAIAHFRRVMKLAPKSNAVAASYGKALLAADSVDGAIVQLSRAKEATPDDPVIYEALGDAFVKQNVVPMAVMNYQKAIDLEPRNTERRVKLARVYEKNRQYTDAVKQFDEIIRLDTTNADAHFQEGNIYLRAKLYKQAVPALRTYTQLKPKSVEGSVLYVKALAGANDDSLVVKEAKRSLKLDSANVDVWRLLAQSQVEIKEFNDALASYDALKRRKAFKPEDQGKYGIALFRLGRDDESLKALTDAIATDSTNCDAYFSLGSIYMKKKEFDKAAAMFDKRIACDPRSISLAAYLNGAASHMQVKNFPRVRELLLTIIEKRPDYLPGRLWMARYYTQVDSLENAKAEYDSVLKEIGTNVDKYKKEEAEAHYLLGVYYFRKQQFGQAVESFRRASNYGYEDPSWRLTWGQAVMQTLDPTGDAAENDKKIDESVRLFRRVIEQDPSNTQGHLWLAQGLIRSRKEGDDARNKTLQEEACNELRKVLKLDPRNEDAKKTMERIGCAVAK
jgi:tetratricopeptide (TPR) repeat protein